jgi:4-carboxymuconolactone decarboxylase
MSSAKENGRKILTELYGADWVDGMQTYIDSGAGFGPEQARWSMEFCYGTVWAREGLERKLRSCAVIGMLIGGGHLDELKHHVAIGIKNGLSKTELEEIFYTTIPYAGFPAANVAKKAMLAVFEEVGI